MPLFSRKKLPLLWKRCLERRDVESYRINFGVSKVCIECEIGHQIAADAVFEIETAGMQHARSVLRVRPDAANHIGFDNQQTAAADVFQVSEFTSLRDSLDSVDAQIRLPQVLFILTPNEAPEIYSDSNVA